MVSEPKTLCTPRKDFVCSSYGILYIFGITQHVTDCPHSFSSCLYSLFGLTFSRLLDMASTGYISNSAIFSSSLVCSICFSHILLSSGFFSYILIHSQGLSLNILVASASFVYILLWFHRTSLKLVLFVNTGVKFLELLRCDMHRLFGSRLVPESDTPRE